MRRRGEVLTYEEVKPLLQQLLKDRLDLVVYREMKDFRGYALVLVKNGLKLQPSKGRSVLWQIACDQLKCSGCSSEVFAGILVSVIGHPVADITVIKGNYHIRLNYALEGDSNSSLPSIFTAVRSNWA